MTKPNRNTIPKHPLQLPRPTRQIPSPQHTALPKSWNDIRVGSLVIAHEGSPRLVGSKPSTEVRDDVLTLRWPTIPDSRKSLGTGKTWPLFSGN